jgi:hypothetical protein
MRPGSQPRLVRARWWRSRDLNPELQVMSLSRYRFSTAHRWSQYWESNPDLPRMKGLPLPLDDTA